MTTVGTFFDDLTITLDKRSLVYGGAWRADGQADDPDGLRRFYNFARKRESVVLLDVGASTGAYCLLAKHLPMLTVYAFEPVPDVFNILCNNIAIGNLEERVHPMEMAIFDVYTLGMLNVVYPESQRALSIVNGEPGVFKRFKSQPIVTYSIDNICDSIPISRVDAIKIDVEGGERYVLEGAAAIIARDKPALMVEYSAENTNQYGYNPDVIDDLLKGYGYRYRVEGATAYTEEFWE